MTEPQWVVDKRNHAALLFKEMKMPQEKSEEWRYTNVEKMNLDIDVYESDIKTESENKKIIFCDMKTAIKDHAELVKKYFMKSDIKDKVEAMQAAFWTNGIFLYVPKNLKVPLARSVFFSDGNAANYVLIVAEEGSSITYVEEYGASSINETVVNNFVEIFIHDSAFVEYVCIENLPDKCTSFSTKKAYLDKDAKIEWVAGTFSDKLSRTKIDTIFNGPGSSGENIYVFLGTGKSHHDVTTNAYHNVHDTKNDINSKGVLMDESSSVYRGLIKIDKPAQQTKSYLSDSTLKLGSKTIANSIPSLQIDANDVKASHGATVGQIDENQIFYMMSRGMTRKQAESLIVSGFFEPVISRINIDEVKEKIRGLLEAKMSERR